MLWPVPLEIASPMASVLVSSFLLFADLGVQVHVVRSEFLLPFFNEGRIFFDIQCSLVPCTELLFSFLYDSWVLIQV